MNTLVLLNIRVRRKLCWHIYLLIMWWWLCTMSRRTCGEPGTSAFFRAWEVVKAPFTFFNFFQNVQTIMFSMMVNAPDNQRMAVSRWMHLVLLVSVITPWWWMHWELLSAASISNALLFYCLWNVLCLWVVKAPDGVRKTLVIMSLIAANVLHVLSIQYVSVVKAPCILDLFLSMSGSVFMHCIIIISSCIILMVCQRMTDSCDYVFDSI